MLKEEKKKELVEMKCLLHLYFLTSKQEKINNLFYCLLSYFPLPFKFFAMCPCRTCPKPKIVNAIFFKGIIVPKPDKLMHD